jgi:hypothetical protein
MSLNAFMDTFVLEKLKETLTFFSGTQADFLAENSIVALEHNNHKTGCVLRITGIKDGQVQIDWSSTVVKNGYTEEKKFIEKSAEAISFFLSKHLTELSVIEESSIGTGIDYWLGYDEEHELYDPENFFSARLEISGINSETRTNTVEQRVTTKLNQTKPTDGTALPAYVSVVEHSTPKAHFVKK